MGQAPSTARRSGRADAPLTELPLGQAPHPAATTNPAVAAVTAGVQAANKALRNSFNSFSSPFQRCTVSANATVGNMPPGPSQPVDSPFNLDSLLLLPPDLTAHQSAPAIQEQEDFNNQMAEVDELLGDGPYLDLTNLAAAGGYSSAATDEQAGTNGQYGDAIGKAGASGARWPAGDASNDDFRFGGGGSAAAFLAAGGSRDTDSPAITDAIPGPPPSPPPVSGPKIAHSRLRQFGPTWDHKGSKSSADLYPAGAFRNMAVSTVPSASITLEERPSRESSCRESRLGHCSRGATGECIDWWHTGLSKDANEGRWRLCHTCCGDSRQETQQEWTDHDILLMRAYPCTTCISDFFANDGSQYHGTNIKVFGRDPPTPPAPDPFTAVVNGKGVGGGCQGTLLRSDLEKLRTMC